MEYIDLLNDYSQKIQKAKNEKELSKAVKEMWEDESVYDEDCNEMIDNEIIPKLYEQFGYTDNDFEEINSFDYVVFKYAKNINITL